MPQSLKMRFSNLDPNKGDKVIRMAEDVILRAEKILSSNSETAKTLQMARATFAALLSSAQQSKVTTQTRSDYKRNDEAFVVKGLDIPPASPDAMALTPQLTDMESRASPVYSPLRRTSSSSLKKSLSERVREKKETRRRSELARTLSQSSVKSPQHRGPLSGTTVHSPNTSSLSPRMLSPSHTLSPRQYSFPSHVSRRTPEGFSSTDRRRLHYGRRHTSFEDNYHRSSPIASTPVSPSVSPEPREQLQSTHSSPIYTPKTQSGAGPYDSYPVEHAVIDSDDKSSASAVAIDETVHTPTNATKSIDSTISRTASPRSSPSPPLSPPSSMARTPREGQILSSATAVVTPQASVTPPSYKQSEPETERTAQVSPLRARSVQPLQQDNDIPTAANKNATASQTDGTRGTLSPVDGVIEDTVPTKPNSPKPEQTVSSPENPFFHSSTGFDAFHTTAFDTSESDSLEFSLILNPKPTQASASLTPLDRSASSQTGVANPHMDESVDVPLHSAQYPHRSNGNDDAVSEDEFSFSPMGAFDTHSSDKDSSDSNLLQFGIILDEPPVKNEALSAKTTQMQNRPNVKQSNAVNTSFSSSLFGIDTDHFDIEDL